MNFLAFLRPPARIAVKEFSTTPGGRTRTDGLYSAEAFREDILLPAVRKQRVVVTFDGLTGVASAWLNEVFAHPKTRELAEGISFDSQDYSTIYDTICRHFLTGKRPYSGR